MPDARKMQDALQVIAKTGSIVSWLSVNDPKALEQVRAALTSEDPHFAVVRWLPGDVLTKAEELNISMTEEEATFWLSDNQKHIADRSVERGWAVIHELLPDDFEETCDICGLSMDAKTSYHHKERRICARCWGAGKGR